MDLSPRIAEQVEKLPPPLKRLLDAEFAAGNEIYSIEFGPRDPHSDENGQVALILNHPFRTRPADAPPELKYRELLDQDPRVYEFSLAGSLFTLLTAKFKPMKLDPIGPGPVSPNEAHGKYMAQREKDLAADADKRAADAVCQAQLEKRQALERAKSRPVTASTFPPRPEKFTTPPVPTIPTANLTELSQRFLASMPITYEMWHDGNGYDLETLAKVPENERKTIEAILINHSPRGWRDIEALARIDSDAARQVVADAVHSANPQIRQEAMNYVPAEKVDPAQREALLIKSLQNDNLFGGLSQAIDEVPDFHPPTVINALFKGALNRDGQAAVHFAALLYFLHGKAKEPFDWDHRPFFLRFDTSNRKERIAVFKELCETVGVDSTKYVR